MNEPPLPLEESARLESLISLDVLDTAPEERFDRVTRMAQRMFAVETCLIGLVDTDRVWFKSRQGLDAHEWPRPLSFSGHAILDDEIFIVGDAAKDPRFDDNPLVAGPPHIRFFAGCPIRGPVGHRIGTLCLVHPEPRGLSSDDQATLRDFAAMVEDELALVSQSSVDELTRISNRRGFNTVARHILPLCRRLKSPAALIYFDLDDFKSFNGEHGHEAGDTLLVDFAGLLTQCFRSADIVARLGSDEFAVLLAGSGCETDAPLARLDRMLESAGESGRYRPSFSVGCAIFDPNRHSTAEALLADADAKMYEDRIRKRRLAGWSA